MKKVTECVTERIILVCPECGVADDEFEEDPRGEVIQCYNCEEEYEVSKDLKTTLEM